MKKILISLGIFIFFPALSLAHPGGTAADGGHYCWTNCSYYGVPYGERHFHYKTLTVPWVVGYDELHEMMKGSAGYKKVNNGYKIYEFLTCEDGYTKKNDKCEKPKSKKLKASKESKSLSGTTKSEKVRFVNNLKKKRYIELEDLPDTKWKRYKNEILEYAPKAEILKYAPNWFKEENELN